jgi:hypothetical protein
VVVRKTKEKNKCKKEEESNIEKKVGNAFPVLSILA